MSKPGRSSSERTHQFIAVIYRIGILRCVTVPEDIGARLKQTEVRTVPVVATVAGRTLRTTLLPASGGSYRLFLNRTMRKAAGADTGDPIGVSLRFDRGLREMPVPDDFAAALSRASDAFSYFTGRTTALRREVLRYIEQAKMPTTRARRIRNCVRELTRRARKQRLRRH